MIAAVKRTQELGCAFTWGAGESDLSGGEFAVFADFEAGEVEGADAGADEFEDLAAEGFDHAADLAVAAFGDGDFEVGVFGGVADVLDLGGPGGAVG